MDDDSQLWQWAWDKAISNNEQPYLFAALEYFHLRKNQLIRERAREAGRKRWLQRVEQRKAESQKRREEKSVKIKGIKKEKTLPQELLF